MVSVWVLLAVLGSLAPAIGYLAFRGASSPLRPLVIPLAAWRLVYGLRFNPKILLAISSLILFGAALQLYFVNTPGYDAQVLQISSIVWQALMAALGAALAVPLHLFAIHRFWRARVADPAAEGGRKLKILALRAAVLGLAIWTFDYLVGVAAKIVTLSSDPDFRQFGYFGLIFASFLLTSLLALVRPALSLGLPHPLRTGIRMAVRNGLALYVVLALLAIPPTVLGPLANYLPRLLVKSRETASVISVALISDLNIFQYLAVEFATVLFALGVLQRANDDARRVAGVEARDLPLPAAR